MSKQVLDVELAGLCWIAQAAKVWRRAVGVYLLHAGQPAGFGAFVSPDRPGGAFDLEDLERLPQLGNDEFGVAAPRLDRLATERTAARWGPSRRDNDGPTRQSAC